MKYDNQRQILEALDTLKNQLNFSFQQDLKEEEDHIRSGFSGGIHFYKSEAFDLTTTNLTTVLTITTSASCNC